MKQIIFAATLFCALFITNIAEARHNVKRTQKNQHHRIQHGIRNGSVTRGEARQLHMQQAKIRHYKQMAKADGRITRNERKMIKREQKRANQNIYFQKHDRQQRYGYNRFRR